ncbi:TPA: hypothetical protein N0F65_005653 [Lagenidium giganteum]|uniref:SUI1 domain-containing protein n=1 Tax=Lagenidium giganteum TaxID=4803 RepID=A0AAV2Z8L2_9STRA|nr:TPA: hypothetical protein N0F65_005653 [Lagenidium giganteum]
MATNGLSARERLTRFYLKYNADKLHEIDGVLERYRGKEKQLFTALAKKYGPEPSPTEQLGGAAAPPSPEQKQTKKEESTSPPAPESDVVKDFNHKRLLAFYQKYNPDKIADVPGVLAKYKGKEAQLFNALVKKYGPEPGDSDDEDDEEDDAPAAKGPKGWVAPSKQAAAAAAAAAADDDDDEDEEEDDGDDSTPKMKSVVYCPIDSLPAEYCEYGPMFNEAKVWLGEHHPQLFLQKYNRTVEEYLEAERQIAAGVEGVTLEAPGGKTVKKKKSKKTEGKKKEDCIVYVMKGSRKGRKKLTFVTGLDDLEDVNIKDAVQKLGKRFACSSSLSKTDTGKQMIQLQGDCIVELQTVLPEMFGISEDQVVVVEDKK